MVEQSEDLRKEPETKVRECKECSHYHSTGGKTGRCRRYPPRVTSMPKLLVHKASADEYTFVSQTHWPVVEEKDLCGEFEPAHVTVGGWRKTCKVRNERGGGSNDG